MTRGESNVVVGCAHQAMATGFSIQIAGWSPKHARQVCLEAFAEIDRLERLLSMFIDGSDVDRINMADANQPVRISSDAFACIALAEEMARFTEGAFDPTAGSPREAYENQPEEWSGFSGIRLDANDRTVIKAHPYLRIDLGGIGKGFAVDVVLDLLREWDVPTAFVTVGGSTVAAYGRPGLGIWSGQMATDRYSAEVDLAECALASSGLSVKGAHIVATDPDGRAIRRVRSWATARTAARADALSTAFFLMNDANIRGLCSTQSDIGAAWLDEDDDPEQPPHAAGVLAQAAWLRV